MEGASAAEGLRALEERTFDLLLSDIVMPGDRNGLELAELVRTRWPELPVLLLSGYSDSSLEAVTRGFRVLRKPYGLEDLEAAIREELQTAAS